MKNLYRWIRAITLTLILLAVGIPTSLFILLSIPAVQDKIRGIAERELSILLDSQVEIGELTITPFNRIALEEVSFTDTNGEKAISVEHLGGAISLFDLILYGDIVINYVELTGLNGKLYKDTPGAPLNIDNIIKALKNEEKKEEETMFRLSVATILLRDIKLSYDILSEPARANGLFDKNHITVNDFSADISLPLISNDIYEADLFRCELREKSGLTVKDLHGRLFLSSDSISVADFGVTLPRSQLSFSELSLQLSEKRDILSVLETNNLRFSLGPGSFITPADLACLYKPLSNYDEAMDITLSLAGNADQFSLAPLKIKSRRSNSIDIEAHGVLTNAFKPSDRAVTFDNIFIKTSADFLSPILPAELPGRTKELIAQAGNFSFDGQLTADSQEALINGKILSGLGDVDLQAEATFNLEDRKYFPIDYSVEAYVASLRIGDLLPDKGLGSLTASITSSGQVRSEDDLQLEANLDIENFTFNGHEYRDISLDANVNNRNLNLSLMSPTDNDLLVELDADLAYPREGMKSIDINMTVDNIFPAGLNLWNKYPDKHFSWALNGQLNWTSLNDLSGHMEIDDFTISGSAGTMKVFEFLTVEASGDIQDRAIDIHSDLFDFTASGRVDLRSIGADMQTLAHNLLPTFVEQRSRPSGSLDNDFSFRMLIRETEPVNHLYNLPVTSLAPITIAGDFSSATGDAGFTLTAPYLRQGNKLIEDTHLQALISESTRANVQLGLSFPTKEGMLRLNVDNEIENDTIDTDIHWKIDRAKDYSGDITLMTSFVKEAVEPTLRPHLTTNVEIDKSHLVFNDSVWTIEPSFISIKGPKLINIENLEVHRPGQYVKIDGIASPEQFDYLNVEVTKIDLNYIFETLQIDNVKLGGDATGIISAGALLSSDPKLFTDSLTVKNISFNGCVFGDADVKSYWDPGKKAVRIMADINQFNDKTTKFDGQIFVTRDSLDLHIKANQTDVSFLQPYMQAFTSEVRGRVSGDARIWGNFKYIDLEGRVMAEDFRMKVDQTNTWYSVTDSVIIRPGSIDINNVTLHDEYGQTARLNGYVRHKYFKEPSFEFNITDADDLMVFDINESMNPKWFGRIFADGSAQVKGWPGYVGITCNLTTAINSNFTFVLNDLQEAGEYTFITFRDRDRVEVKDSVVFDDTPPLVRQFKQKQQEQEVEGHSRYDLDFNIAVTPEAQMNLVMDPAGGDRIKAFGDGNLRLTYGSVDEELKIYGTYTLSRGSYNFTLQDIFIKDFTIRDGSSIAFHGNPYTAILDITAVYATNANLSDLDAMFLEDKDISRTNVPVHALLHIDGDLHQPDISFDLEFPTLTQDTYRKVRSIVSTEDMMNRQIIYLLALNRFYTPDYMQSNTKGNELISVASSTLSSQLSNILGQISDKFTIAPSFRSERSDFSDMEVDLALSSTLLNNRLLLNGNFGYRDRLMNANQFIGDFDIEYLLNRKGTLRLKAYNRYNDRNFYFKNALTTQGVGIVIKHDFDNFSSFLNLFRRKKNEGEREEEEKNQEKIDGNVTSPLDNASKE